jgi:hypothetical protein
LQLARTLALAGVAFIMMLSRTNLSWVLFATCGASCLLCACAATPAPKPGNVAANTDTPRTAPRDLRLRTVESRPSPSGEGTVKVVVDQGMQKFSETAITVMTGGLFEGFGHDGKTGALTSIELSCAAPSITLPRGRYVCSQVVIDENGCLSQIINPIPADEASFDGCRVWVLLDRESIQIACKYKGTDTIDPAVATCELTMLPDTMLANTNLLTLEATRVAPQQP